MFTLLSRLSAIYGGTYMLNKPFDGVVLGDDKKVAGVKSEGETVKCKMVVADPSYFPDKCKEVAKVTYLGTINSMTQPFWALRIIYQEDVNISFNLIHGSFCLLI